MIEHGVLIVGGGHGGAQSAIALRQENYDGPITILDEGPDLPYERPPLSKEYLAGEKAFERILVRPPTFWESRNTKILSNRRVVGVAPRDRRVKLASGEQLSYDQLVWATGGRARRLACQGQDLAGLHTIRSKGDVDRLREELPQASKIVIIGGGYIGLEAAAVLSKMGKNVVLVEALDRVLKRVAGEPISCFFEAEHRSHGVDIRIRSQVTRLDEAHGRVSGVWLESGECLDADMVIVGIGIFPVVEPLLGAGAAGGNGVDVDQFCRTTLPDVFAVGDCAAHENRYAACNRIRLESVQNATAQAITAAKAIMGRLEPYCAVPWFWSHQYDLKLQTVGLSADADEIVVRGEPAGRSFSVVYLRDGRVIAIDCVNAMKDYVQGKLLVEGGACVPIEALREAATPLKSFAIPV